MSAVKLTQCLAESTWWISSRDILTHTSYWNCLHVLTEYVAWYCIDTESRYITTRWRILFWFSVDCSFPIAWVKYTVENNWRCVSQWLCDDQPTSLMFLDFVCSLVASNFTTIIKATSSIDVHVELSLRLKHLQIGPFEHIIALTVCTYRVNATSSATFFV